MYPLSVVGCETSTVDDGAGVAEVVPVLGVADTDVELDGVGAAALDVGLSAVRIFSAAACVRSIIFACV